MGRIPESGRWCMSAGKTKKVATTFAQAPTDGEWKVHPSGAAYRCQVYLIPEDDGRFSVIASTLPGVASQGKDEQDALANIREALAGAIQVYRDEKKKIPWKERPDEPDVPGTLTRWIVVHV
jgi:predicted RNase H-like HicB family nuclease